MTAPRWRVGILDDLVAGPPSPSDMQWWIEYACTEATAAGRLGEVEFVPAYGLGLPRGSAAEVERAFADLVRADVHVVIGPAIGDNALIATPLAERHGIPTINWAGSERARGDYMFHLQVGSHEDESVLVAEHLAAAGIRRVGVLYDESPIGERHLAFLHYAAAITGLAISQALGVAPTVEDAAAPVRRLLAAEPDALVYFGVGLALAPISAALRDLRWDGPRFTGTAGIRGHDPAFAPATEGWTYVDMHADDNEVLAELSARPGLPKTEPSRTARGYDMGRLVAEGLARAPEPTRDGVREGLERVKWLAAAEGHRGTMLSFGHRDRGALHGRYLVLRQWQDGHSVQVPA